MYTSLSPIWLLIEDPGQWPPLVELLRILILTYQMHERWSWFVRQNLAKLINIALIETPSLSGLYVRNSNSNKHYSNFHFLYCFKLSQIHVVPCNYFWWASYWDCSCHGIGNTLIGRGGVEAVTEGELVENIATTKVALVQRITHTGQSGFNNTACVTIILMAGYGC